jgi:arylsulfatase A-like enzyme
VRTGTTLAPLVACLGVLAACTQQEEATARRGDARPNIVIFVTDTLRADALEAYGNAEVASPALTALASRGVVYERATTSSTWTRPAIASIL